jgi:Holliday junction resolvasome RuvABC endonuclease subunit
MNYLGLDCSSLAVHGVIIDDDEKIISMHKWGSKNKDFTQRFPEITLDFFDELSRINNIDKSSIEAAIFIQNPKTTIAIAHVVGAVWLSLLWKGIETNRIENTKWKKIILNKGNASKDDIKQFSIDKWGDIFPEQDYADAACIALYSKRRET